ncbi:MAG: succinate dehydrogenase assembly factor 2 [Hyphomicrobiales bacterium]|nr:succinate dehydrogenase assembly factor 2 [Hyphomicrobiales bacterium]
MTTGTTRSSDGLSPRRRRILFRAWHRGIKEMDILYGRFADAHVESLSDDDMDALERLFEEPDQLVLTWITGAVAVAPEHDTAVFRRLQSYSQTPPTDLSVG